MTLGTQRVLTLLQPTSIAFGVGCAADCAAVVAQRGARHVALVSSPSVVAAADTLATELREKGLTVTTIPKVPAEPDVETFEGLRRELRTLSIDAVIGLGGGSVLDVAKLLAAMHRRTEPVRAFFGSGLLPERPNETRRVGVSASK